MTFNSSIKKSLVRFQTYSSQGCFKRHRGEETPIVRDKRVNQKMKNWRNVSWIKRSIWRGLRARPRVNMQEPSFGFTEGWRERRRGKGERKGEKSYVERSKTYFRGLWLCPQLCYWRQPRLIQEILPTACTFFEITRDTTNFIPGIWSRLIQS